MSAPTKNGWHKVDHRTRVRYQGGEPVEVGSTRHDLDRAEDDASQFHGQPLDFGQWHGNGASDEEWLASVSVPEFDS